MSEDKFYFTSGELAKMSGASYKTIRHYVDKGLLKPEQITEHGYKMFGKKSIEDLQKILLLKYLDFPLEEIRRMIYDGDEMVSFTRQEQLIREKLTHLEEILHAVIEIRQLSEVGRWDKMLEIMRISSRKEEIRKNYLQSDNLEKRINIHIYSTAEETWYQWLFEKFELKENMQVLDVGCGNAEIWLEMRENIPNGVCITLVDVSRAMLDKAKKKIMTYESDFKGRNIKFIYKEMDATRLSIEIIVIKENMMKYNNTLDYYNNYADEFYKNTVNVEFATTQEHFLAKLKNGSNILDFGCGSGRDTRFFLEQGYSVEAVDGSKELCKLACKYTGIEVKNMLFEELSEVEKYDGIWACSSILHLPLGELADVMKKMAIALKEDGIIYTSFKYGNFEGERNGRYFTDMTEEKFAKFLSEIDSLDIEEQWITSDVRPGRGEERWLNLILRKI